MLLLSSVQQMDNNGFTSSAREKENERTEARHRTRVSLWETVKYTLTNQRVNPLLKLNGSHPTHQILL